MRERAFIATKVWTRGQRDGVQQMTKSGELMKRPKLDLIQVHNLLDLDTHLKTLRAWKEEGRVRYIGITHYTVGSQADLAKVIEREKLDFVQLNYALDDRAVERRLLPLAAERGTAVIVNQPFGGGGLLRKLLPRKLPDWAGEIGCASWAEVFLKFVVSHPAVTCAIPATSKVEHMNENMRALTGPLPDEALRQRMIKDFESL